MDQEFDRTFKGTAQPVEGSPDTLEKGKTTAVLKDIPVVSNVSLAPEADLSFASIIKGTAANPLNNFEIKAAYINAELDKFGMGKYQWCIWFLCGFGRPL